MFKFEIIKLVQEPFLMEKICLLPAGRKLVASSYIQSLSSDLSVRQQAGTDKGAVLV